jgi:hypothetical protein
MAERLKTTELKASLVQAKRELQDLLTRAGRLKEWIAATEKLCGKKGQSHDSDVETGTVVRFRRTKAVLLAAQVAAVLKDAGKPMHVREIVAELAKRQQPVTARNPVATVAVALGRRAEQFAKTGPNTFDLVEKEAKVAG